MAVLVFLLVASIVSAEFTGTVPPQAAAPIIPVLVPPTVSSSPPDSTWKTWIRSTDYQAFFYDTLNVRWVGEPQEYWFGKNATGVSGMINFFTGALANDTTSATTAENGYLVPGNMFLCKAEFTCGSTISAPQCSSYVYQQISGSPPTVITKLPIVSQKNRQYRSFVGATADSGKLLTAAIVTAGTVPNEPLLRTVWREYVNP